MHKIRIVTVPSYDTEDELPLHAGGNSETNFLASSTLGCLKTPFLG
jgi:hypothetical protein